MALRVKLVYKLEPALDVEAPPSCTFGQLKELAAQQFGVPKSSLALLFRGRPKPDKAVLFAEGVKNGARIKVVENEAGRQQHAAGLGDWEAKKDERGAAAPGGAADPGGARQPHCQAAHGGASAQHAPPAAQAAPGDADARRAGPAAHGKPGGRPAAARAAAAPPEHAAGGQPHAAARAPGAAAGQAAAGAEGAAGAHGGAPGAPGGDAGDAAQRAIASVRSAVDALEAQAAALPADGGPEAARTAARLAEALTQKLLALDAVEVGAAHRGARRAEIDRINRLCEALEARRP